MLIKSSILNAISVVVKITSTIILNKILAIYVGVAGYAAIGQFQNIINLAMAFTSNSISQGVIKHTSEYESVGKDYKGLWRSALFLTVSLTIAIAFFIIIFSDYISISLLGSQEYKKYLRLFSVTLILYSINGLLLSVINGFKDVKKYVKVNISGSIISLLLTGGLSIIKGLEGALYALTINQSLVLVVTLLLCKKESWFLIDSFVGKPKISEIKKLLGFFIMAVSSSVIGIILEISVRSYVASTYSWEMAGLWDTLLKMSSIYMLFITSTLGFYFLPKFSAIREKKEVVKEIYKGVIFVALLSSSFTLFILFSKELIVSLLFTKDFYDVLGLMDYFFLGEIFKSISWLLGIFVISRSMVKEYIFIQLIYAILFYLLTLYFTARFSGEGLSIAYLMSNFILLFIVFFLVAKKVFIGAIND